MFDLRLFGGLSLESPTLPVQPSAQQRRRISLLVALALVGERGMTRERIQAYLWPDSPADRARHALDQLLYATRRDLGADVIVSTASDLRLNRSVIRPDIWLFDDAIREREWRAATDLYAGPVLDGVHLVDGGEFEQLVDSARSRREYDHFRALESLAREAASAGDPVAAVHWWRRRVELDPLSAPAALELMRALVDNADRSSAIQYGRTYQRLVRQTLEVEPDPAVESLLKELSTVPASTAELGAGAVPIVRPPSVEDYAVTSTNSSPTATRLSPRDSTRRPIKPALVALGAVVVMGLTVFMKADGFAGGRTRVSALTARVMGRDSHRAKSDSLGRTAANGTTDPDARSSYLRGRALWNKRTSEGLKASVVEFHHATDRDPAYAAAYTGLADSYAMLGYFGFAPADAMFPKARAAALRALELDPSAGEAYAALGQSLAWQHEWGEAEKVYQRALALAPNDATVHQWYALLLSYVGRAHEAAVHTGHASQLDPLSVQINNMYGMMLYYDGDLQGALRQYDRTVVAEPDSAWVRQNPWVLSNFARVAAMAGRHEQALHLASRAVEVVPRHPRALFDLAAVYAIDGDAKQAMAVFARADSTHPHYAFYRAWLHAMLGELDEAYVWLDKIDEWALPSLVALNNDPTLATLRADPRFERVRKKLSLPIMRDH
jgi:DNA-binding SARP family transcriptional activator/tetratricopeptide (TPR) repeat protein